MSNLKNQAPMIDPVIVRDADHKRPLEIGPSLPVAPFRDLIDRHQLAWYCRAIHELARGIEGIIIPMAICPSPTRNANDWNEHSRFRVGEIDPMISQIEDWVLRGANVYVPWCVFRPDTPPSSRGGRGHAISVLALVSDRDADNGKFGKTVARPTYQIISSRVPATNSNELYVFTQPVEPEAAAELGRKLRIAMGADSGTGDIVRLVRVAGTANFPSFKKISERQRPRQPQAVRFGDDATSEPIDFDHLLAAIAVNAPNQIMDPDAPKSIGGASIADTGDLNSGAAAAELSAGLPPDLLQDLQRNAVIDRSAHSFRVTMRLFDHGLSDQQVISVLSSFPSGASEKFNTRGDLALEIRRCRERWLASSRSPEAVVTSIQPNRIGSDMQSLAAPWPSLNGVLHGITGEVARLATEHTEADPIAVAMTHLVWSGAAFGRLKHFQVGDENHHARLFSVIVGDSSRARKGTSLSGPKRFWNAADRYLRETGHSSLRQVPGPMSSGEGIIHAIRDKSEDENEGGSASGTDDKRLLVIEGEFSAALKAAERHGNTLSAVIRSAWDGTTLSPLTKSDPMTARDPHVCIVAHITRQELNALLAATDIWNGFANRFIWLAVRRSKIVPSPQPMAEDDVDRIGRELARLTRHAYEVDDRQGRVVMSNQANDHWVNVYPELTQDHPGLFGVLTARAEAQVLRLALTYALLDGKNVINEQHLEAALSLWRYSADSIKIIFAGADPDPDANKLMGGLRQQPMTQTEIGRLFGGHKKKAQLEALLGRLQAVGRIRSQIRGTGGRSEVTWFIGET